MSTYMFYAMIQVEALAFEDMIRLLIQILSQDV